MKKLFNYALLAAALLVGVNVNAVNVAKVAIEGGAPTEYEDLIDAFNAVGDGETATITMLEDADFSQTCRINLTNKYITWDLAGCTVGTADAVTASGFFINKGLFHIKNSSEKTASLTLKPYWNYNTDITCSAVNDHAGFAIKVTGSTDPNEAYGYTTLTIDENVNFVAENTTTPAKDGYAIHIEKTTNTNNPQNGSFGVTVNVNSDSYIRAHYSGIFVSGNVQATTGNVPVINIGAKASILATNDGDSYGLVGNGYAIWNILGRVEGCGGIYAKSGVFNILGEAAIIGNGTTYQEPTPQGNGCDGGDGCGIILDSKEGYAGNMVLNISGDVTITGVSGYGITEVKTDVVYSSTQGISISGGTVSGVLGSLATSAEVKDNVVLTGSITGGTFSNDVIENYINQISAVVTPVDNEDGTTSYVVTPIQGGKEAAEAKDLDVTTKDDDVMLKESKTIEGDAECKNLVVENAATLTVGKKLTVYGTLTIQGKVIIAKDATLIIKGNGVTCLDATKFVIEAQEDKMGQFLLSPNVKGNKHPKATVSFTSKSWGVSATENLVQFFGVPMIANGVTKISSSNTTNRAQFDAWNGFNWVKVGVLNSSALDYSKFNRAFGLYSITSNNPNGTKMVFDIEGSLMGIENMDNFKFDENFTTVTNSWTGDADMEAIFNELKTQFNAGHTGLQGQVYKYRQDGNTLIWDAFGVEDFGTVEPMQPFMFSNTDGAAFESDIMNYENLVWKPATTETSTPGAPKVQSNIAKATIRVADAQGVYDQTRIYEDGKFSAENDFGYDGTKYMNDLICLYVNADKAYANYANSDVNNTFVGFNCKNAGKYTISFENVTGNFALVDMMTNARIEMSEGTTYEFLAEAGEDAYRFQIVTGAKAPTDMQKTNAAVKATRALINGQIVISNGERFYNVLGTEVK